MSEATTLTAPLPDTREPKKNPLARTLVLPLLLAIGTLLVYWPARQFEFTNYDDQDYVYENPMVIKGLTAEGVRWAFTTRFAANWHPLTWLSHMVDCQLWGADPVKSSGGHHMTNVLLHAAATVALFFALRRMTRSPGRSAIVAALFALHPLHVESVAWVAERKDVLSGLFWMLTIWAYVWYTERPGVARYSLVVMTFAMGLMSKPMVVTLPCVLLLLDYWPLQRGMRWLEKIPLFALSVASSMATFIVQRGGGAVYPFAEKLSLAARIANAFVAYVSYLGKTLLPENLAERLRENARVKVCAAAGAARHDQLDWPRWPLRAGGAGGEKQQESANLSHRAARSYHVSFCTEARPSPRPATSAQSFSLTSATAPRSTRPWATQRRSRSSIACSRRSTNT